MMWCKGQMCNLLILLSMDSIKFKIAYKQTANMQNKPAAIGSAVYRIKKLRCDISLWYLRYYIDVVMPIGLSFHSYRCMCFFFCKYTICLYYSVICLQEAFSHMSSQTVNNQSCLELFYWNNWSCACYCFTFYTNTF